MHEAFKDMIKIGITFPKKNVRLPKNWQKLTESKYKNEVNYAILTGKVNDIIVIDLDNKDPEFVGKVWFEDHFGKLEELNTLVTHTINNGFHVYFKYTNLLKNKLNYKNLNIDILVDNKCVYEGQGYSIVRNEEIRALSEEEMNLFIRDEYTYKSVTQKTSSKKNKNEVDLNKINDILNMPSKTLWSHEKTDNGFKCTHTCSQCLVNSNVHHKEDNHSTLFVNNDKSVITTCFSHGSLLVKEPIAQQIYNLLYHNEDVNNRDTLQVAEKFLEYKNLIYQNKAWFLYNDTNGIYEKKDDLDIIKEISLLVKSLSDDNINYNWFEWIKKINYKKNLIEELKAECKLNSMLDNNPYLLGFPNGVLDLHTKTFRKGLINEHITMVCGVEYKPECDTTLAEEVLTNAFLNIEEREYVINKLAMCLDGKNYEQQIGFLYGYTASNGKSFLMERMRSMLGDYGGSFPVTLLTNKMKGAGEANSSLGDFLNKRFMYCSEPESGSKLNTNMVKQLTGDIIKTRNLYQDKDIEIRPSYNIFVCCNTLPNFDTYDEGIARRISIMEFKTKFCLNPKKKNERLIRKYNDDELSLINMGLMNILVNRYHKLYVEDFVYGEPDSFKNIRKMFLNDNKDIIKDTLLEMFEKSNDKKDYIKLKDIKDVLKSKNIKEKDVITIIRIVMDTFEDTEFKTDTSIEKVRLFNIFIHLKYK